MAVWVVDQRGVKAFAQHAILILTTNVGQKMIADMAAKGNSREEIATRVKEAMLSMDPNLYEVLAGDEILAGAILDRLLHSATVLNIQGRSYRLRDLEAGLNRVQENGVANANTTIDETGIDGANQTDPSTYAG